jgi:serine/threonine-protein kinase
MGHPGVGSVLGGTYRLQRVIGTGGMGTVYEAVHTRLPRRFAVKVLFAEVAAKRDLFERFRREAEIASAAGHEHIVEAYDFNLTEDGLPYIVMELLEGESLRERLDRVGKLSVRDTAEIIGQSASAVGAAHARGIVHRDLKPENIFLCKRGGHDFVKVLDFGVSKLLHSQTVSTETGALIGTPQYMAPEQASGAAADIDPRTDVFALGAIAYECLTGDFAFQAPTPVGVMYSVVHSAPRPMRELRPDVPEALDRVIERALSKPRSQRYQDCQELTRDLRRASGLASVDTMRSGVSSTAATAVVERVPEVVVIRPVASRRVETLEQASLETAAAEPPVARSRVWLVLAAAAIVIPAAVIMVLSRPSQAPSPEPLPALHAASAEARSAPQVRLRLVVQPPTARVELDGVITKNAELVLPRSEQSHELVVSASGYTSQKRSFRAVTDGELVVELAPEPSVPVRAAAPPAGRRAAPASRTAPSAKAVEPAKPLGPLERSL